MSNPNQKTYNYRVFDDTDNFLATWDDVVSEPSFSQEINSAGSELRLVLARDPDTLSSDVDFNNKVIITIHDKETPEGQNLFQGFISEYRPYFSDKEKYTEVVLLGFGADLADYMAENFEVSAENQVDNQADGTSSTFPIVTGQDSIALRFRASYDSIRRLHLYLDAAQAMENFDLVEDNGGLPTGTSVLPTGTSIVLASQQLISAAPDIYDFEFVFPFGINLEQGKYYHFVISPGSGGTPNLYYDADNVFDDYTWLFNDNAAGWFTQTGELNFLLEPANLTTTFTYTDIDPVEMLRDILDNYILRGGKINYDGASLEPSLTTATYTFKVMSILECINKIIELCPANFYWYVDQANNILFVRGAADDYEHKLVYGKNIAVNELNAVSQTVVNTVYFTGGEVSTGVNFYKKYFDQSLIDTFGVKAVSLNDNRVTLEATADTIVNSFLKETNSARLRANIQVIDSNVGDSPGGYDIESITVGQVISLANIGQGGSSRWGQARWGVDKWGMNFRDFGTIILQIGRLTYSPNDIILEAKELIVNPYKQMAEQSISIGKLETVNNPTVPD